MNKEYRIMKEGRRTRIYRIIRNIEEEGNIEYRTRNIE
jgi:hypothetical protein